MTITYKIVATDTLSLKIFAFPLAKEVSLHYFLLLQTHFKKQ